jgi:hypothetical protein
VKAGAVHPTLVLVLRVRLFGPLTLELDGVPLRVPTGATARSVLAWLLLHPGLHMRAHVAARFWPDVLDGAARGSLRTALWEIRRAVGGEIARRGSMRVANGSVCPGTCRAGSTSRSSSGTGSRVGPKTSKPPWSLPVRRCSATWSMTGCSTPRRPPRPRGRDRGGARQMGRGEGGWTTAIEWSRRAVRHAPLDESADRALMRRPAAVGERGQALAALIGSRLLSRPSSASPRRRPRSRWPIAFAVADRAPGRRASSRRPRSVVRPCSRSGSSSKIRRATRSGGMASSRLNRHRTG